MPGLDALFVRQVRREPVGALFSELTESSSILSLNRKSSIYIYIFSNTRPSRLKSVSLREAPVETLQVGLTAWVTTCLPSLYKIGKAGMLFRTVRQFLVSTCLNLSATRPLLCCGRNICLKTMEKDNPPPILPSLCHDCLSRKQTP